MIRFLVLLVALSMGSCGGSSTPSVHVEKQIREMSQDGFTISTKRFIGTGFFVSQGVVMTAAHVVADGPEQASDQIHPIYVYPRGPKGFRRVAKIIAIDYVNDIALLKIMHVGGSKIYQFCAKYSYMDWVEARAFRYPTKEVTAGKIMGFIGGNANHIRSTAPVDGGYSGAPLILSRGGCVVGVIQQKEFHVDLEKNTFKTYSRASHPAISPKIMSALRKYAPGSLLLLDEK